MLAQLAEGGAKWLRSICYARRHAHGGSLLALHSSVSARRDHASGTTRVHGHVHP